MPTLANETESSAMAVDEASSDAATTKSENSAASKGTKVVEILEIVVVEEEEEVEEVVVESDPGSDLEEDEEFKVADAEFAVFGLPDEQGVNAGQL